MLPSILVQFPVTHAHSHGKTHDDVLCYETNESTLARDLESIDKNPKHLTLTETPGFLAGPDSQLMML